jgi:hypothetical protein
MLLQQLVSQCFIQGTFGIGVGYVMIDNTSAMAITA